MIRIVKRISVVLLVMLIVIFWLSNITWFRIRLANYYIGRDKFDEAIVIYKSILRKQYFLEQTKEKSLLNKIPIKVSKEEIKYALKVCIEGHFKKAIDLYKKRDFGNALKEYDRAIFAFEQLYPFFKTEIFNFVHITNDEISAIGGDTIYKLCKLAIWSGDYGYKNLRGVNLLPNSILEDPCRNNAPLGYIFSVAEAAGILDKEIIPDLKDKVNIYHVWVRNRSGWFATYFKLGRVPNDVSFVFSIETREVDVLNHIPPHLFTTTEADGAWNSGTKFMNKLSNEFLSLGNEWKREFFLLRTKDKGKISLNGWLVSWNYGAGSGDIYVKKPKVEIGDKATAWTDYLVVAE